MTHEEAIEELKILFANGGMTKDQDKAIEKAIANMEQFRKFDEPVEMEVSNSAYSYAFKANILGKFDGKYLGFNGVTWKHARPIKPKVLSFTNWFQKIDESYIGRNSNNCGIWKDEMLNDSIIEYTQYLNDNK